MSRQVAMSKSQLYVVCDLEGASGISPANREALQHGSKLWREQGRRFLTSDVRAVCDAAVAFGIDEIILNDAHDTGMRTPNVLLHELPSNVRALGRPHLLGSPRRKARGNLYGVVFVGQHAMYGGGGFAPHTIQSPPIRAVAINGLPVGEIGLEMATFMKAKLLAVIGEAAAVAEARRLCPGVTGIPVKSLEENWFPAAAETEAVIRRGVLRALQERDAATGLDLKSPYRFTLTPCEGYGFDPQKRMRLRWLTRFIFFRLGRGHLTPREASWQTSNIVGGLYVLQCARLFMSKSVAAPAVEQGTPRV